MSSIFSVAQVNIDRETKPISQASFGTILIVGPNPSFSDRVEYFTDLADVADALAGGENALEYLAAKAIFSQSPVVEKVAIGKKIVGDASYSAALDAIKDSDNSWYGLIAGTRTQAEQVSAAGWALSNEKFCSVAAATANIIDTTNANDTTTLAAVLKAASNFRTSCFYSAVAATEFVDAGYLGKILPYTPGTYSGAYKTISGVTVDSLTPTQSKNAHDKFCNTYEEMGEQNKTFFGYVSDGDYSDTIIFIDWLRSRIAENIYALLANAKKIPFDDNGIGMIESAVRQILEIGQSNGAITKTAFDPITKEQVGGFKIIVPRASSVLTADKAARFLQGIKFVCWYSGAIHTVRIDGTVTL